jgi:hypothetical protein
MKIINISQKKFNSLPKLQLPNDIINTEAELYHFRYHQSYNGILKKLHQHEGNSFANKLYTIEMLDYYQQYLPINFVIPDTLISIKGEIKSFGIPEVRGTNLSTLLKDENIPKELQLYFLKEIGIILDKLKNIRIHTELKDIFIGDLQECNFIANPFTKDLYVIDLDSCKIAGNLASPARYLTKNALLNNASHKYIVNKEQTTAAHIIPNEASDLYCYTIIILNYLYGANINNMNLEQFYEYLNYLEYLKLNVKLLEIFESVITYKETTNPKDLIDTLSTEQIIRAKNNVYLKVKRG